MKTAAIYSRVSTADQVKGTSLDTQVSLCQDYAREHGYTVLKVMQEDASGARLDRPKLGELRHMAQRREIEALIVFDPDRLSRSMAHTMMLMEEFERNRADVLFVNAPREDTPEGEMLFGMRALFAQYERTKIAERTRRGKERRIREGQVMTSRSCSYGYEYIRAEKRIQVLESEARWVRKMYEWLIFEACSLREISRRLEEHGVPTKRGAKAWDAVTIRNILRNEVYAGVWHYGKRAGAEPKNPQKSIRKHSKSSSEIRPREEWLSVEVPAIISDELFKSVQTQLHRNREMSPRHSKHQFLFRGLLVCGRCGHKLYGHATEGRLRYECPGRVHPSTYNIMEKRCDQPRVEAGRIETLVWDEVARQLGDEKELRKRLQEIEAERMQARRDIETELEMLANLEMGLKREANKLLDLHMGDVIDRDTLQERMAVIREKQANIAKSKAEVTARLAQWNQGPASDEAIKELVEIARLGLPHATFAEKRAFLEGMSVKLTIDGNQVTVDGLITQRTLTIADKRAAQAGRSTRRRASPHNSNRVAPCNSISQKVGWEGKVGSRANLALFCFRTIAIGLHFDIPKRNIAPGY